MKRLLLIAIVVALTTPIAIAQEVKRGESTNLPVPRFVSLKSNEANARRGPNVTNRIDWVFTQKHMPLEIFGEYENWRRVRDVEGFGGWIHYSLLSGVRTVQIITDLQPIYLTPDENSQVIAKFGRNVIADLEECNPDWCRVIADGNSGWAPKSALWGVYPDEIRE